MYAWYNVNPFSFFIIDFTNLYLIPTKEIPITMFAIITTTNEIISLSNAGDDPKWEVVSRQAHRKKDFPGRGRFGPTGHGPV